MFDVVVLIVIISAIYIRVKRMKKDGDDAKGSNSLPGTTVPAHRPEEKPGIPRQIGGSLQTKPAKPRPAQTVQRTAPARSDIQEAKEEGNSTTAYLAEKAEADAREHAKEKFEEQKRLYETRGGLTVAERFLDGDIVPQGKRCINCGYCGAENLIPMIPKTKYSCYFCREPL